MKNSLDLQQLLCGEPARLRYVKRFSTCRVLSPETVAEHSFFTALYAMLVADWVLAEYPEMLVDVARLLRRALVHDLEEARTGDMPRFFKYQDLQTKQHIEKVAEHCLQELLAAVVDPQEAALIHSHWSNAKDESIEGRIIAFSDFLSVLGYAAEEMRSSNRTMREHLVMMKEYAEGFLKPDYAFLRPLVDQALCILEMEVLV